MPRRLKKCKSLYVKGRKPWNYGRKVQRCVAEVVPKIVRLPLDVRQEVGGTGGDGEESMTMTPMSQEGYKFLRPLPPRVSRVEECSLGQNTERPEADVNRRWHIGKTEALFNHSFREHRIENHACSGHLVFDRGRECQSGMNWREGLMCSVCTYKSPMYNLYKEVASGDDRRTVRRASATDAGLQDGLSQTSIGK